MLADWVEQDGLARSVLAILLITTLGCFTYTWGYYEGIQNSGGPMLPSPAGTAQHHEQEHAADYAVQHGTAPADHTTPSSRQAATSLLSVKDNFEKHVQARRSLMQAGLGLMAHAKAGRAQIGEQLRAGSWLDSISGADRALSSDSSSDGVHLHHSSRHGIGEQQAIPRLQQLRGSS